MADVLNQCQRRLTPPKPVIPNGQVEKDNSAPSKSPYSIAKIDRLATSQRSFSSSRLLVHGLLCMAWTAYFMLRMRSCWMRDKTQNGPISAAQQWLLLLLEILLAGPDILTIVELTIPLFAGTISQARSGYKLTGNEAPSIHVFVTACGEDLEVVMDTVTAAAVQDYPKGAFQVFVLDDAKSAELRQAVHNFNEKHIARGYRPVVYLSRDKKPGVPHYYKAGNLHYGVQITRERYGDSEFIAALDADMIPEHDWLRRCVAHLVLDQSLALVGPPQISYNIPDGDALAQDSNVFQQVLEPLRDRFGCSQCSGSGYLMRRKALDSIGGWPLTNIGEDILCSYQLVQAGWKSAFIEDEVQFGMAPGSLHAYVVQRIRWTAGSLLIASKFRFFLPFLDRSHMTSTQRFYGFLHSIKTYIYIALIIPLLALPVILPLSLSTSSRRDNTTRYAYIALWLLSKIWKRQHFGHLGSTNMSNTSKNRYWVVPYHVYAFVQSFLVDLEQTKFVVSGSFKSPLNERSAELRAPFVKRMTDPLVVMHTIYWGFAITGFLTWLVINWRSGKYSQIGLVIRLLEICFATFVPVKYMAFPPTVPLRRDCLEQDESGAYRSIKKHWSERDGAVVSVKDFLELGLMIVCG